MEGLNFLAVLAIFSCIFNVTTSQGCGRFCVCTLEETECYFTFENGKCLGEVSLLETYILKIHGPVCANARKLLKTGTFHNTVKIFYNDACNGIPNCR